MADSFDISEDIGDRLSSMEVSESVSGEVASAVSAGLEWGCNRVRSLHCGSVAKSGCKSL